MYRALALLLMFAPLQAAEIPFYLGTNTRKAPGQGIQAGTLDSETGRLGPIHLAIQANNPGFVAVSPDRKYLYAALEAEGGAVGAYSIKPDFSLHLLNIQPTGGKGTCHVWIDPSGRHVFTADYSSGHVACFPLKSDGYLNERSASIQLEGSGPDPKRQTAPHAHGIYTSPDGKFLYVCDLGTDKVWSYRFDAAKGSLSPTDPPAGITPPGSGPRHLAFHPSGKFVYVNNEMGLSVTAFARDIENGTLTALHTLPTLPPDADSEGVSTSEILCHPTGKWLYVSNREADTIAVYAIAGDGRLTSLQNAPAEVKIPRGMAIDPTGKWLVTAGQDDNRLAVLKIDQKTGLLSSTGHTAEAWSPICVEFVK